MRLSAHMPSTVQWPKIPTPLTAEQLRMKAEFLKLWHELLPTKYQAIEAYNHGNPIVKNSLKGPCKTLEIGAGLGAHLHFEDLREQDYTALEIRPDFTDVIIKKFPSVKGVVADIQKSTPFKDDEFDRILAIHVLEHLPDLPSALKEVKRILKPGGEFVVVIPCEGGLAYGLARRISAQRVFEKKFKTSYLPIIRNEHINEAWEIIAELEKIFLINQRDFWPLKIPSVTANLVIALDCRLRPEFR